MSEKIIRDPVHDVIAFAMDRPVDALLFRLINAAEFQRLRRIRQLGMANLAYPGAEHTRYSHSLGVMQTARRILAQLTLSCRIDESEQMLCLVGALLHDLGHGPFSHVFERVADLSHEALTTSIIENPDSQVHRLLAEFDGQLPDRVLQLLSCRPQRTYLSDILCSQLDADRFDYLLRDNLMTGSRYGDFDLEWLVHALAVDSSLNRLVVTWKGVSAIEAYLQSRYHMYRNVYFHKVVRSAEGMVKLALQRAKRLAAQGRLEWPPADDPVYKALFGQTLSIREFTDLDDVSVLHCFKLWTGTADPVLGELCRGLLYRRLYKTIDLTAGVEDERVPRLLETAHNAITAAGGEPAYAMFYDEPADTAYETYQPLDAGQEEILIVGSGGQVTPLTAISPLPAALNRHLMFRRVHVAPQWVDLVRKVFGDAC